MGDHRRKIHSRIKFRNDKMVFTFYVKTSFAIPSNIPWISIPQKRSTTGFMIIYMWTARLTIGLTIGVNRQKIMFNTSNLIDLFVFTTIYINNYKHIIKITNKNSRKEREGLL